MNISIYTVLLFHVYCVVLLTCNSGICTGSSKIECIQSEREALLRFKYHLIDPSNRLSSWNASNPNCCHWTGVVCSHITANVLQLHLNISSPPDIDDYYSVDEYEKAYAEYGRLMLGGEINTSLVELKHLTHLDLSLNNFGGMQIPTFLGEMTSLTYLNLSDAGFNGSIPHQIGNLSNLLFLDLSYSFSGAIPYQIGNLTNLLSLRLPTYYYDGKPLFAENRDWFSGLSHIQYLDLSYGNLSKSFDWLQTLQALPSLKDLRLSNCILPSDYNQPSSLNFSSLNTLDFSHTGISSVPKWIFGLRKLVSLQLDENIIQDPISGGIQNLTLLENLDLSSNLLSSIPDWLYGLHHLKFLNLVRNNLRGNISDALGNLTSLVTLDLSHNQLEGGIPTSLGNLCSLTEIGLSHLKLNQQVNEILEILTPCVSHRLTTLRIWSSHLSGNLTDQIGMFKNLAELNFFNNSIRGALPISFGKLSSLIYLDLSENQFNGNPFEFLRSLSKLSYISIDGNLFQGVAKEDDFANLTSLKEFYASGNNITLEVGPNWHPSFQLHSLGMSSWKLGPTFPSWIRLQKNLYTLEMSNTGISDVIPPWFWETISHVYYLNLSHNHIHGELTDISKIAKSILFIDLSSNKLCGKLPYLSGDVVLLDLSSNLFSGTMTDFLCRNPGMPMNLELMKLASNNLSGEIPDCWRRWTNLGEVNLQSNHFVGKLPQSMGSIASLESLHIGNNTLFGTFPHILKNNSGLISLDLGGNKLTGSIPTWVGERLSNLKILCLRSNKFLGHIPNEICALNFLQVLDLAQNNFSGNIPSCFNQLSAMTRKNKSADSTINLFPRGLGSTISMILRLKGREDEYRSILGLVISIDLSENKLSGEIPKEITSLYGLIFLNLSHNQLTGHIPSSIGNMRSLQSIDFSRNELYGQIPQTISNLTFLSELDLSYNHLNGEIPIGPQIQTFNASNFVGNNLCGPPLPLNCSSHRQIPNEDHLDKESDGHEVKWFFVSMAFGFIVGFWGVVAPLFMFRSWRHTYYRFLGDMWYKIQSWW